LNIGIIMGIPKQGVLGMLGPGALAPSLLPIKSACKVGSLGAD